MPAYHLENLIVRDACSYSSAGPRAFLAQRNSQTYALCFDQECGQFQGAVDQSSLGTVSGNARADEGVTNSSVPIQHVNVPVLHLDSWTGYYHALMLLPSIVPFLPQLQNRTMRLLFTHDSFAALLKLQLQRLGIGEEALLNPSVGTVCAAEWHVQRSSMYFFSPAKFALLRQSLHLPNHPNPIEELRQSVAILSRGNDSRSINNEEELVQGLRSLGRPVEVIHGKGAHLADIIERLSRTQVLLGPHGANMVNMIYAPEGTKVVEIMPLTPFRQVRFHFQVLASVLKFPYMAIGQEIHEQDIDSDLAKSVMTQDKALRSFAVDTKSIINEVGTFLRSDVRLLSRRE
jgi:hypothetical protein